MGIPLLSHEVRRWGRMSTKTQYRLMLAIASAIPTSLNPPAGYPAVVDDCFQRKTAENPRPMRAGRKGGKARRALKKIIPALTGFERKP